MRPRPSHEHRLCGVDRNRCCSDRCLEYGHGAEPVTVLRLVFVFGIIASAVGLKLIKAPPPPQEQEPEPVAAAGQDKTSQKNRAAAGWGTIPAAALNTER